MLSKPPIVEAWLEFHVEGPDTNGTWPTECQAFLSDVAEQFPVSEGIYEDRVELLDRDAATQKPKVIRGSTTLQAVRAFDENRTRCVQAGQRLFVFNLQRSGTDYPGFSVLLKESFTWLAKYISCFRPHSVTAVALHYVDLIPIPGRLEDGLPLDEYFTVGVSVPDKDRWPLSAMIARITVPLSIDSSPSSLLHLQMSGEPYSDDDKEFRFLLHWHAASRELDTLDPSILKTRLEELHSSAIEKFQDVVTPKLWDMFEPTSGERS